MIKRVKTLVGNNRVVLENFSFLSILQVSNLIIFFLMIPFLFRVLGKENYGVVVFAQTIAAYFAIFVNFGFNATATRDISINRNNLQLRSDVISSVLIAKSLFFIISFALVVLLSCLIPFIHYHRLTFFFSMLFCLSEALFPIWYFQGVEKMRYITYINVTTRVFSAFLIFFFIDQPEDYFLVPLFLGTGTVTGAFIGLLIIFISPGNRFRWINMSQLKKWTLYNLPLFISNASSQVYVNANRIIIGPFLGMHNLAVYDIAERLVNLLKVPLTVIGQVLFPKVSTDGNLKYTRSIMFLVISLYLILYVFLFFSAEYLIILFSGSSNPELIRLLRILGLSIIPISAGLFYSDLLLVPFGYMSEYARMRAGSLIIYLLLAVFLFATGGVRLINFALIVIVVETFVLVYSFLLAHKKGLTFIDKVEVIRDQL